MAGSVLGSTATSCHTDLPSGCGRARSSALRMNPNWPAEIPLAFQAKYPAWLGKGRVVARVHGGSSTTAVMWESSWAGNTQWVELGERGRIGQRVTVDLEFVPRSSAAEHLPRYQWTMPLTTIRHERLDDVVIPFDAPALAGGLASGVVVDRSVFRHKPETLVFDASAALDALRPTSLWA